MMRLPKTVMVCGSLWTVLLVDEAIVDGQAEQGSCDPSTKIIEIGKGFSEEITLETFIHEYLHAVNYESGYYDHGLPDWAEHLVVSPTAKDIVRNAKVFVKVLKQL